MGSKYKGIDVTEYVSDVLIKAQKIYEGKKYKEKMGFSGKQRQWIKLTGRPSYDDNKYLVEMYVFEGSAPKMYVIVNNAINRILILNADFKKVKDYDSIKLHEEFDLTKKNCRS
jgi:hypothetical protein